jgi:streptogramin lyase
MNPRFGYYRTAGFLALAAGLACSVCVVASGQSLTEFPLPAASSSPGVITSGPDGNLWFTETTGAESYPPYSPIASAIGRITPAGVITEFPTPLLLDTVLLPRAITTGPDGNLWFTAGDFYRPTAIGRVTTSGVYTTFDAELPGNGIAAGSDGNLWTAMINVVGRTTTGGISTAFAVTADSVLEGIAAGADGNLWFTDLNTGDIPIDRRYDHIGRITIAGVITEFALPAIGSYPMGIAAGPDGNVWFTEWVGNKIGRITPAGQITEFPIPEPSFESQPLQITAGPDGNLWFTQQGGERISRITTSGVVTTFFIPASPGSLATGPDGNLWITTANGIGKIDLSTPVCPVDPHVLCVGYGRFSVRADFRATADAAPAPATAVSLTRDTGYFWFFDAANVELVVKVLDGCQTNHARWVFAGGLTNVGVDLTVTDALTGAVQTFSNTGGEPFQPVQDTSAFPCY